MSNQQLKGLVHNFVQALMAYVRDEVAVAKRADEWDDMGTYHTEKAFDEATLELFEYVSKITHLEPHEVVALRACLDVAMPSDDDKEPYEVWNTAHTALRKFELTEEANEEREGSEQD